jgi:3-phosphoshikimate 1-carboxyvinyltransferase
MKSDRQCIQPFKYAGQLNANASKSYFQRAMAIAALSEGKTILRHIQWSADTQAVRSVIEQLGSRVNVKKDELHIVPGNLLSPQPLQLNVGESGLALRMFSSVVTLLKAEVILTGKGSLIQRPVLPIIETLTIAGARIYGLDNKPPLSITGPLSGGEINIDGSFSSQILTGLLIALPLIHKDSIVHVANLTSRPYIDMTMDIMRHFGVEVDHEDYQVFYVKGNQQYVGRIYDIEGDWSGAANHLVGAAISGEIIMTGLNAHSSQADRAIVDALTLYGADIHFTDQGIHIKKNKALPFVFDATQCPDIFPPLVALAASVNGASIIKGTGRLIHKESNRLVALIETFEKLGVYISKQENQITVHGTGKLKGHTIDSFNDHRIAMAAAISATLTGEPICIERAGAVSKSYPDFYKDLERLRE